MAGSGSTTTLVAILANAGQADQAVATAGRRRVISIPVNHFK